MIVRNNDWVNVVFVGNYSLSYSRSVVVGPEVKLQLNWIDWPFCSSVK
jgi:hypothetical protein